MKTKLLPYLVATSMAMLAGCGGGGGSDSSDDNSSEVTGLDIPVTLSVVTAKETTTGSRVLGMKPGYKAVLAALNDPNTDFTTDEQHAWVHDRALEPLDEVNNILCYIGQTAADQLVNQTYVALVDGAKCEREGGESGGQNQSSGGGKTVELEKWIVESTRADNDSPQYVRLWIPQSGDDWMKMEIRAEVTVTEGSSDANPFGKFVLNFSGVATEDATAPFPNGPTIKAGDVVMSGTLKTVDAINGKIGFTLYQDSPMGGSRKVSVVTDADQTTGVAFTGNTEYEFDPNTQNVTPTEKAHAVAFNSDNILIKRDQTFAQLEAINSEGEGNGAVCLSRNAFKRNVWRYNLYNAADGSRVAVNSGIPFRWDSDSDGANDSYGYVGYWGIWSEKEPDGGWDGATITKETWGQNATAENYTVMTTPGKLTKRERQTIDLSELDGVTFHYNEWDPNTYQSTNYVVEYDSDDSLGATDGFYRIKTIQYTQEGPPSEQGYGPALVDISPDQWLGMYSEALGGSVNFIGGNDYVTFFKESFVDGTDTAFAGNDKVVLDCYTNCLKPNLTNAQYEDPWNNNAYYTNAPDTVTPAAVYEFDKATLSLTVVKVDGTALPAPIGNENVVNLGQAYTYTKSSDCNLEPPGPNCKPEPWGVSIDGMVPSGTVLASIWDTYDQPLSFRWETGHKSWNSLVRIKDAQGTMFAFDKPLAFSYKHVAANDANYNADPTLDSSDAQYFNQTFMLNYGGNGDLWGIPWVGDWTQGESRPAFALADGTLMGASNEYAVKAIDMELKPLEATGQCGALVLNQPAEPLPSAPSGSPSNVASSAPTPDSEAPAVIGGEVVAN